MRRVRAQDSVWKDAGALISETVLSKEAIIFSLRSCVIHLHDCWQELLETLEGRAARKQKQNLTPVLHSCLNSRLRELQARAGFCH